MAWSTVPGAHSRFRELLPASSGNSQPGAQGPHLPGGEPSDNNIPCLLLSPAKVSSPMAFASYLSGGWGGGEWESHFCQEGGPAPLGWAHPWLPSSWAGSLTPAALPSLNPVGRGLSSPSCCR